MNLKKIKNNIKNVRPYVDYKAISEEFDRKFHEMRHLEQLWFKIHTKAQTNEGLKELMDKTLMYYYLLEEQDGDR